MGVWKSHEGLLAGVYIIELAYIPIYYNIAILCIYYIELSYL